MYLKHTHISIGHHVCMCQNVEAEGIIHLQKIIGAQKRESIYTKTCKKKLDEII